MVSDPFSIQVLKTAVQVEYPTCTVQDHNDIKCFLFKLD